MMPDPPLPMRLLGRQVYWVAVSGLVLGTVWGILSAAVAPPTSLLDLTLWVILQVPGGAMLGLIGGFWVGVITGPLHALVAGVIPVPQQERLYRWVMRLLGIATSVVTARYGLALLAYWAIDFNWDLGWNQEDFPTLRAFLWGVVVPTLFAGLGGWWATERVSAWYVRTVAASPKRRI